MTSIYFIGGTGDFAKDVVNDLEIMNYDVKAIGRSNGYEINLDSNKEIIKKIAKEAIDYDVVINYTYAKGYQFDMLMYLYKEMVENNYQGYLINFGSSVVLHNNSSHKEILGSWDVFNYQSRKKAIQAFGHEISRNFTKHGFKFTNINNGMMNCAKMRVLSNFRENCLNHDDIANVLDFLIKSPKKWHLHEMTIDGR